MFQADNSPDWIVNRADPDISGDIVNVKQRYRSALPRSDLSPMLTFATEFPVGDATERAGFLAALKQWVLESPHTQFTSEDLPESHDAERGDDWTITRITQVLRVLAPSSSGELTGVQFVVYDNRGIHWRTEVVLSRDVDGSWIGLRLSNETDHPALRLPDAKKPVLVRTLLERLGGGNDGGFVTARTPHHLTEAEIGRITDVILARSRNRLPVVYCSRDFDGSLSVDINALASDLAGLAHVVTEPSRIFSRRLQLEVGSGNVYGGAIGIYWPETSGLRSVFLWRDFDGTADLKRAIIADIRAALLNRRPLFRCTIPAVQERVARERLRALRASGSAELAEYANLADEDMGRLRDRLQQSEAEIGRLHADVARLQARPAHQGGLLRTGAEQDFFPGETLGIVMDALQAAAASAVEHGRRAHVLTSLIDANPGNGESEARRNQLKEALRTYQKMTPETRRTLEELGFTIDDDKRHIKLTYRGDDRYVFALAKTGSDVRGGLNSASDIGKRIF